MIGQLGFCRFKTQKDSKWAVGVIVETPRGIVIYDEAMVEKEEVYSYKHLHSFGLELGLLMAREIALLEQ